MLCKLMVRTESQWSLCSWHGNKESKKAEICEWHVLYSNIFFYLNSVISFCQSFSFYNNKNVNVVLGADWQKKVTAWYLSSPLSVDQLGWLQHKPNLSVKSDRQDIKRGRFTQPSKTFPSRRKNVCCSSQTKH